MDITQRCHLQIEDLSVARGERVVLGGVSLQTELGRNRRSDGSQWRGQIHTLRAIAGFLPPASGRASWKEPEATESAPLTEPSATWVISTG